MATTAPGTTNMTDTTAPDGGTILVVGYGNTLRSDDAAGPLVAEIVAGWGVPGATVLAPRQLTPELAEALAAARLAVFVDACVGRAGDAIRVEAVRPSAGGPALGHIGDPGYLLELAQAVYGRRPEATWLVTIPATDFGPGERLSPTARRGIEAALERIAALIGAKRARVVVR